MIVCRMKPFLEFVLEAQVLLDQEFPFFLRLLAEADGLRNHGGYQGQETHVLLERRGAIERDGRRSRVPITSLPSLSGDADE